ncbi:hypothetical protein ACHAXM_010080, partial [Skeletonema potamos]
MEKVHIMVSGNNARAALGSKADSAFSQILSTCHPEAYLKFYKCLRSKHFTPEVCEQYDRCLEIFLIKVVGIFHSPLMNDITKRRLEGFGVTLTRRLAGNELSFSDKELLCGGFMMRTKAYNDSKFLFQDEHNVVYVIGNKQKTRSHWSSMWGGTYISASRFAILNMTVS